MATFLVAGGVLNLQLSTLRNLDHLLGLVATALGHILDRLDDLVALQDLTEDDVAAIKPTKLATG